MADRWRWRALRLAHGPNEVWLVAAHDGQADGAQRLPLEQCLALFDGSFRQATFALRAFVRDNGLAPSLGLVRDHHLLTHVRQQIAVGALVGLRPGQGAAPPPKRRRILSAPAPSSSASAPVAIRRGPAPEPASLDDEGPEFTCPGPQAQALREAAAAGVPFCAECQRAADARAARAPT